MTYNVDVSMIGTGTRCLTDSSCPTCGDVAIPVKVIAVNGREATAEDEARTRTKIAIDFITDVKVGDILLVHLGVAIGRPQEVGLQR